MTAKPAKPKLPCDGPHDFHPHAHPWAVKGRKCSERYWCLKCERWYDAPPCKPKAA